MLPRKLMMTIISCLLIPMISHAEDSQYSKFLDKAKSNAITFFDQSTTKIADLEACIINERDCSRIEVSIQSGDTVYQSKFNSREEVLKHLLSMWREFRIYVALSNPQIVKTMSAVGIVPLRSKVFANTILYEAYSPAGKMEMDFINNILSQDEKTKTDPEYKKLFTTEQMQKLSEELYSEKLRNYIVSNPYLMFLSSRYPTNDEWRDAFIKTQEVFSHQSREVSQLTGDDREKVFAFGNIIGAAVDDLKPNEREVIVSEIDKKTNQKWFIQRVAEMFVNVRTLGFFACALGSTWISQLRPLGFACRAAGIATFSYIFVKDYYDDFKVIQTGLVTKAYTNYIFVGNIVSLVMMGLFSYSSIPTFIKEFRLFSRYTRIQLNSESPALANLHSIRFSDTFINSFKTRAQKSIESLLQQISAEEGTGFATNSPNWKNFYDGAFNGVVKELKRVSEGNRIISFGYYMKIAKAGITSANAAGTENKNIK